MKKLLTLVFLLNATLAISQNGINYKAIISDGAGNIVSNQLVVVQFAVLDGGTSVYQENHTPTTNDNGLIILNIGEGTPLSGTFDAIDWSSGNHFLNVQVNTGGGLQDLGTTAFKTVPYALSAANVQGLELLDEGNGDGYRLIGKDPLNYGNIGLNALDLSDTQVANDFAGATGESSVAIGNSVFATGLGSVAIGAVVQAQSLYATALGYRNKDFVGSPDVWVPTDPLFQVGNGGDGIASNALNILKNGTVLAPSFDISEITDNRALITKQFYDANTVSATGLEALNEGNGLGWRMIGRDATKHSNIGLLAIDLSYSRFILDGGASGDYATAIGREIKAEAYNSLAIGQFNIGGGNPNSWMNTDPLLEIGNGTNSSNLSNALTVLKNGTITAPSFDISEITDDKALITKEYADANLISSGLEAFDEGNGLGWRLINEDPNNHGDIGLLSVNLSNNNFSSNTHGATGERSLTLGFATTASGDYSTAIGARTIASGGTSTAMGSNTEASTFYATAMGDHTMASGNSATAMGHYTTASGLYATSIGSNTKAEAGYSTSLGRFNIGGGTAGSWNPIDPLFEIGNGDSDIIRDNALTVLKNGKVGIGASNPDAFLEISSVNSSTEPTVKLVHEGTTGARINFTDTGVTNGNRWTLYGDADDADASSVFNINHPNAGNIVRIHGDGEVGINGVPDTELHVRHGAAGGSDGFKLQNTGPNANWWRMYVVNSNANLNIYSKSQGSVSVGNFDDISGAYAATSDRRLKKNFKALHFNWKDFMNMETLSYEYKAQKDKQRHIGLIAQDVEDIYPELISYNEDDDVYHLNYSGLGVVAIKAIQEQQKIIDTQASKIEELEAKLSEKDTEMSSLNSRISKIEGMLSN